MQVLFTFLRVPTDDLGHCSSAGDLYFKDFTITLDTASDIPYRFIPYLYHSIYKVL